MSRHFKARIAENRQLNKDHNLLTLIPLIPAKAPEPGQFYMLGSETAYYDPLLKRPFSLFRKLPEGFQILYRIRGKGTSKLSGLQEDSVLDILGPLGNSYPLPEKNQIPVIIAGGIGIASVFSLAESLGEKAYIFYGARTKDDLLMLEKLKEYAKETLVSTDDGSYGEKGNILDTLTVFLTQNSDLRTQNLIIYACGPKAMFKPLRKISAERNIAAYVSVEETVACGIGVCLGCVVKTADGYERVCQEGPVFPIDKVVW